MSQLRAERYERLQFEGDPFATYVQSIGDAALVLRIMQNEKNVERNVEGIRPIQRARFVFQSAPASFLQLKNWRWWTEILLTPISRELRNLRR